MSAIDDTLPSTDFEQINQNNFQIIKNKAIKIGYSDGVNDGREGVFQQGFDKGYKDGIIAAFNLQKYKFFFENLGAKKVNNASLVKEKDEFLTLQVRELKSLQIEGNNLSVDSQDYIKKTLDKYTHSMPLATQLLNA